MTSLDDWLSVVVNLAAAGVNLAVFADLAGPGFNWLAVALNLGAATFAGYSLWSAYR